MQILLFTNRLFIIKVYHNGRQLSTVFTLFHLLEFIWKIDKPLYHAPFEAHGIYLENKFAYQIFWKNDWQTVLNMVQWIH